MTMDRQARSQSSSAGRLVREVNEVRLSQSLGTHAWGPTGLVIALLASVMWVIESVQRHREDRKERSSRIPEICDEINDVCCAITLLTSRPTSDDRWSEIGWREGERRTDELGKTLDPLKQDLQDAQLETYWDVVASLRALHVAMDPDRLIRSPAGRVDLIERRVADLIHATDAFRASGVIEYRPVLR